LVIALVFILAKNASLPILAINPDLSLLLYALSWVMLICGIAICGKEGWYMAKSVYKRYWNRVIEGFKKLDWYMLLLFFLLIFLPLFLVIFTVASLL